MRCEFLADLSRFNRYYEWAAGIEATKNFESEDTVEYVSDASQDGREGQAGIQRKCWEQSETILSMVGGCESEKNRRTMMGKLGYE